MDPEELLFTIELKCTCCGEVQDSLLTPWKIGYVAHWNLWTREPCDPCEERLAKEDLAREERLGTIHQIYDPRD